MLASKILSILVLILWGIATYERVSLYFSPDNTAHIFSESTLLQAELFSFNNH